MENPPADIINNNRKNTKQFWQHKWGPRNIKFVQDQTQCITAQFVEKIGSAFMQLDICCALNNDSSRKYSDDCVSRKYSGEDDNDGIVQDDKDSEVVKSQDGLSQKMSSSQSTEQASSRSASSSGWFKPNTSTMLPRQKQNLQQLYNWILQAQSKLSNELLSIQTMIQNSLELKNYLVNYQNRVKQLQYVLGNKQCQLVVQHTGLDQCQMRNAHFKAYIQASMEFQNLICMNRKIEQARKEINKIYGKHFIVEQQINKPIQTQIVSQCKKSKQDSKQNQTCVSSTASKNYDRIQTRQNTFDDPFFKKIIRLFKNELQRENSLKKQYQAMLNKSQNLSNIHKQYVSQLNVKQSVHMRL